MKTKAKHILLIVFFVFDVNANASRKFAYKKEYSLQV